MRKINITIIALAVLLFAGYSQVNSMDKKMEKMADTPRMTRTAVFAGGCFWCTESDFEKIDGVVEAISGYTGGKLENPTYKQVSAGGTGHVEAVKVVFNPARVGYEMLLEVFWRYVDPTDAGGQFVDRGSQYRSAIFYANDEERQLAEKSKKKLAETGPFNKPIVTDILPLEKFYPAEDYHQDYYKKNPIRYHWYRSGSGRDQFLEKTWAGMKPGMNPEAKDDMKSDAMSSKGDMKKPKMGIKDMEPKMEGKMPSDMNTGMKKSNMTSESTEPVYTRPADETLRRKLSPLQYKVTRENGTEPPFNNEFWDNHRAGIYVDVVSGEPLFSSNDKYDSKTGWPSFTRPLEPDNIVEKTDRSFFMVRTEVRSKRGDSHLGHLFPDGPKPTGLRYCINSAALRFVPKEELEKEGYGKYMKLFE